MTFNVNAGEGSQALSYNQAVEHYQYAVADGCAVSINTGTLSATDTLSLTAGTVIHDGTRVSVAAQNVGIGGADATNPRKDVVYIDGNGDAQVAPGTPEAAVPDTNTRFETYRPVPEDLSATAAVVVAEVWVPAGASSIVADDLRDRRVFADATVNALTADSLTAGTATADDLTSGVVEFDPVLRDTGRFEMIHLNTFNVGGDAKQAEVNLTISDYTTEDINKILLFCEHLSVYTASGGNQTFAVQINGQSGAGAYENMRVDGTTTSNDHAIIAKGAANTEPMMGHVWFHADQDFMVYPEGAPRAAGIDGTIHRAAVDNAQSTTPWTIDSLRFYTPDGDEIRMRRATVLGFSEGAN